MLQNAFLYVIASVLIIKDWYFKANLFFDEFELLFYNMVWFKMADFFLTVCFCTDMVCGVCGNSCQLCEDNFRESDVYLRPKLMWFIWWISTSSAIYPGVNLKRAITNVLEFSCAASQFHHLHPDTADLNTLVTQELKYSRPTKVQ